MMRSDIEVIDREFVGVMRGWQILEEKNKSGYDIVDFDLVSEEWKKDFSNRNQVVECLTDIRSNIENDNESEHNLLQKVVACETFSKYLLGINTSFEDYIWKTLRIKAKPIPEEFIEEYKESATKLIKNLGIDYSNESFSEYMARYQIHDGKEVEKFLNSASGFWVDRIKKAIDYDGPINYTVSYVQKDEPWCVGLWGDTKSGVRVLINTHSRHQFTQGQCKYLPSHEIAGHAVQFSCRQHQLSLGKLRAAFGMVSVFNPDIALSEGLAQALPYFLVDENDLDIDFAATKRVREHRDMVLHNTHLFVENGMEWDDAMQYCLSRLPFLQDKEASKEIEERLNNPLLKTYMFCYAPAFLTFKSASNKLTWDEKKDFLKKHYYDVPNAENTWLDWMPF